jgi:hypothetical protein
LPEVREKLAALKLRQQMSAESVPALKKVVAEARSVYGYPKMPREIYQDGKLISSIFIRLISFSPPFLAQVPANPRES